MNIRADVFWSEEDAGYIAVAPDYPGCAAFGVTEREALTELADAVEAWLEVRRKVGNTLH